MSYKSEVNFIITVIYNDIQSFINPGDLSSPMSPLNMKKVYELQGYVFNHKPDIVILNWLKNNTLNSEIYPKIYIRFSELIDQGNPSLGSQTA